MSVITPCHENRPCGEAALVDDCVRSVHSQSHPRVEHIVVDDCSDPPLSWRPVADGFAVKVIRLEARSERAAARNAGIAEASGDFLLFLDGDDLLAHDGIEVLLAAQATTEADVILGMKNNIPASASSPPRDQPLQKAPRVRHCDWTERLRRPDRFGTVALYRRSAIEGVRFNPDFVPADDLLFALEAMVGRSVATVEAPVYYYRIHTTQTSATAPDLLAAQAHRAICYFLANHNLTSTSRRLARAVDLLYGEANTAWRSADATAQLRCTAKAALAYPRIITDPMWWLSSASGLRLLLTLPASRR